MRRQERKFPMTKRPALAFSGTGVSDEAAEAYGIPSGVFVSQVTEAGQQSRQVSQQTRSLLHLTANPSAISAN